ncbi:MAG: hypothetical protein PHO67_07960 [Candidatus Omnitrophica bacterium]|nr:hypothetical protein [Candidatus Omnitrophota bacterium]
MGVKNLDPVCQIIWPGFLGAIEKHIKEYSPPETQIHREGMEALGKLALECGFEKEGDTWVQFPKQRDTFERAIKYGGGGDILETLCNGDIVIKLVKQGKAIVTTDGAIYYYSSAVRA